MRTWSADKNIGKKLLLSTLLRKAEGTQANDAPPGWLHYLDCFNACDSYNVRIGAIWWPYRIGHWKKHFDEMFHVHVLLNTVAAWRELQNGSDERSLQKLLVELAHQLMERAHNGDLPHAECT